MLQKFDKVSLVGLIYRGDAVLECKFDEAREIGDVELLHEVTAVGLYGLLR